MNLDQALAILRAFLLITGTLLMKHGWTNDSNWADITGAVLAMVPLIWSFWHHSDGQQAARAIAVMEKQEPATSPPPSTPTPPVNQETKG